GRWKSVSSTVSRPSRAKSFARCGPTPLTNCSGVDNPCERVGAARSTDGGRDLTGGKKLPRLTPHAIRKGPCRQTPFRLARSSNGSALRRLWKGSFGRSPHQSCPQRHETALAGQSGFAARSDGRRSQADEGVYTMSQGRQGHEGRLDHHA